MLIRKILGLLGIKIWDSIIRLTRFIPLRIKHIKQDFQVRKRHKEGKFTTREVFEIIRKHDRGEVLTENETKELEHIFKDISQICEEFNILGINKDLFTTKLTKWDFNKLNNNKLK